MVTEFSIPSMTAKVICGSPNTTITYTVAEVTSTVSVSNGISALSFISVDMSNNRITVSDSSKEGNYII
jgi:hypothetical protein